MTCLEKYKKIHPDVGMSDEDIIEYACPNEFVADTNSRCIDMNENCEKCWNSEVSEPATEDLAVVNTPKILDSGDRTEFESGAVRDMRVGKGRCDLMPLDVVADWYLREYGDEDVNRRYLVFSFIDQFKKTGNERNLFKALDEAALFRNSETMFLEVAKHFEEGCIKYGEDNWRKGIPAKCYIDSAIRHYLKHMRGDRDEPHDRAFCWNILCCIWTIRNHPELNDYKEKEVTPNG